MSAKNYWLAFGIGVSAGAAIALLYAPQSGDRTRKNISRMQGTISDRRPIGSVMRLKGLSNARAVRHRISSIRRETAPATSSIRSLML
jgi:gas vesicle protein